MAPFTPEELDEIVAREKPGYRVKPRQAEADAGGPPPSAVAGASLGAWQRKSATPGSTFVDVSAAAEVAREMQAVDAWGAPDAADQAQPDALIVVEPETEHGPVAGATPKSVLISGKTGRIIAQQG